MNRLTRFRVSLTLIALVSLVGTGVVTAESPPATPPPGGTLDQRIAQRKAERAITLNESDQQRLVSTCVNTQSKLRLIQKTDVATLDKRAKVYGTIDAKLWVVIGQLKLADKDTFRIEKQRLGLADKTATFQTAASNYKQAMDDSLLINCQADPVGFKAMIDTLRIYYSQLRDQASDSHDYVIDTIKPSLQDYADSLRTKSASNEEEN